MKKILLILFLLLLTTGCSKKLTCTGKIDNTDTKIITKFNDEGITNFVSLTIKFDVKDYYNLSKEPSNDEMKDYVKKVEKEYEDTKRYDDIKVSYKGKTITVKCSYKLTEKETSTEDNYDNTKKLFEDSGFTCN